MTEPLLTRLWNAVKPPPPVPGQRKRLNRSQRRLILSSCAIVLLGASGWGAYAYLSSAQDRADERFQEGLKLQGPGHYQEAIDQFTKAIAIWPKHARAYLERGTAHQILNQTDAAMADFQTALSIDPTLAAAGTALGSIYQARGDNERALAEFSKSIKILPTLDAYYQRGQIYQTLGQFQQATEDYDLAISLRPDAPFIYRARAIAKRSLGDSSGSAADLDEATQIEHSR